MTDLLKRYFIATRPWSFTMSLISVTVGVLLAAADGAVSYPWFALTILGIVCVHAGANVFNDYFDTRYQVDETDSPTAKYRTHPILSGMLTPRQLLGEGIVLLALAVAIGLAASALRSFHILWIGLVGMLTCVFYTAGPVKFKYRALGELAVFTMWGPLMVEGAYAVQRQALSMKALYVSVPFGLLVALVLFANNFRDIAYDSRHEVRTLGILLGQTKSHHLFTLMIAGAFFYVIAMIAAGVISLWGLLILLSLPQAIKLIKTFREKIPDMADALAAQFNMAFGVLLLLALFLENLVIC
ncbi:MAG: prenyltransferase [Pseudomonadota bacterium]|nr:prenyltransferase [Pseudomonadota bacterium]